MANLTVIPTMDIAGDIDWLMVDAIRIRTQWPAAPSCCCPAVAALDRNDVQCRVTTRDGTALLKLNVAL